MKDYLYCALLVIAVLLVMASYIFSGGIAEVLLLAVFPFALLYRPELRSLLVYAPFVFGLNFLLVIAVFCFLDFFHFPISNHSLLALEIVGILIVLAVNTKRRFSLS